MNSSAGSYISSTVWAELQIAKKARASSLPDELNAGFTDSFRFLLIQHGLIHMAEVPGISVSSVSKLYGDGVTLLERGKLVRGQSESHRVG